MFTLLVALGLLFVALELAAAPARRPSPRRPPRRPRPEVPDSKEFSWTVTFMNGPLHATCGVEIRRDAYEDAVERLLGDPPSKTHMRSCDESFDIAIEQILDADAGAYSHEVEQIAERLLEIADENLLSNYEFAQLALSFVHEQNIRYVFDDESKGCGEYFRFPLETVVDAEGDCDCKAILACAIYKALSFDVAFALMPGHAALAIASDDALPFANWTHAGRSWYYCEATGDEWVPGALPSSIRPRSVELKVVP